MLCEQIISESVLVGYGPGAPPMPRCNSGCCARASRLQIRTRLGVGSAKLCAEFLDPESDPPRYHTEMTITTVFREYDTSVVPNVPTGNICTRTRVFHSGDSAIIDGSDCEAEGLDESYEPAGCDADILSPDPDRVWSLDLSASSVTYGGDSATLTDVEDAAITNLEWGEWSEWTDYLEVSPDTGAILGGSLDLLLSESSLGGLSGPGDSALASRTESELRVFGAYDIAIVTTAGPPDADLPDQTVTRTTLVAEAAATSFPSPTPAADAERLWLRCVTCPKLAATA